MEVVSSHKNHSKNLNENAQIKDQQTTSSCSEKTERKREKVLDVKHIHLQMMFSGMTVCIFSSWSLKFCFFGTGVSIQLQIKFHIG